MESILKVAEAAVAAQNAANQAKLTAMSYSATDAASDPNLDPSLFSNANQAAVKAGEANSSNVTQTDAIKPAPPHVDTITTESNATASSSAPTPTSAATSSSSLSNNPYLSLSTNLLPRGTPGSTTPTGHPMFMPYPLFYPPGASGTPNGPPYPMPYNPYYYLAAPMPGPNGMYPPPGNFTPPPQQQRPPHGEPQRAKPKRLKTHTVTTKSFSIPMVPRDKKGKPMLPLNVGIMTVINLGEVCMREHFHTERYIFPVGYEVTRSVNRILEISIRSLLLNLDATCRRWTLLSRLCIIARSLTAAMGPSFRSSLPIVRTSLSLLGQQQARGRISSSRRTPLEIDNIQIQYQAQTSLDLARTQSST